MLKTFCGEVAVLVLVFPLLDWYLATGPEESHKFKVVIWSPVLAAIFLSLSIGSAVLEKKYEDIEKGGHK